MDEPRGRLRLFLCVFAASLLLQARLGVSQTLAFDGRVDMTDEVSLNCLGGPLGIDPQPATFTFRHPITGEILRNISTTSGQVTLTIAILPENEAVVSCMIMGESTESQRIAIAGLPQYTRNINIQQYVFSNSTDVVILDCPLSAPGSLSGILSPYQYSWLNFTDGTLITSDETIEVIEADRSLRINLSTLPLLDGYHFQCNANVRRCNGTVASCTPRSTTSNNPPPPVIQLTIVDVDISVTPNPPSASVTQNEGAPAFNCEANGFGTFVIKWEVDGVPYDRQFCNDAENCTITEPNGRMSRLELNTEHIRLDPNRNEKTLNIVCVVNQTLRMPDRTSLENATTQVILPNTTSRTSRSGSVQLKILPPVTTPPTVPATTPPGGGLAATQDPSQQTIIIIVSVVLVFILLLIIILAFCVVCIFRYHYKKYDSNLGRKLRRTFSKDPSALAIKYTQRHSQPQEIEPRHFQGTDTPPMIYNESGANVVTDNHLLTAEQGQIYNYSQNSGVSSYSGLSGVSQNTGPHQMPQYKEPSVVYVEGAANLLAPPTGGSGAILSAERHSNGSRRTSDASGSIHSGHSLVHQQQQLHQPYVPTAFHGSHNNIGHQHQLSGGHESASLPRIQYISYATPPHAHSDIHQPSVIIDPQSSLPVIGYPSHSQLPGSQTGLSERALSIHSNHSHRSSGRQSPASTHSQHVHFQAYPPIAYGVPPPPPQSRFISSDDLMTVELALLHNKNCQIPGCCCYRVREIMEKQGHRVAAPNDSPEMSSITSSSASGSVNQRQRGMHAHMSSTDSDSDYSSANDRRLRRPYNLRLLSDEHNRNPNLHPHYHLTTKSYLRRVSTESTVDHRRSKSLSDLTPLTEVSESTTPAKTPAVGGVIKPGTPVYDRQPPLGETTAEEATGDELSYPNGHPALLREISISADNIPALCLNDCPFTPSPLKEGRGVLAQSPNRGKRWGGSFRRGSVKSAQPSLKTVKEKTSSVESDESNTSSRPDTPNKSSVSDDDGIVADIKPEPAKVTERKLDQRKGKEVEEEVQTLSLTAEAYHDSALDSEVREILQNGSPSKDIHKPRPSYSPLLNRRNDSSSLSYLSSTGCAMTDPRMRRSISPLSVGSQVSTHSRRSTSPYETEVRKQNGVITEITEC